MKSLVVLCVLLAAVLSHAAAVQKRAEVEEMVPKLVNDIMDENAKEETAGIEQDQVEFSEPQEAPEVDEGGLMRFRQLATPRDGTSSTCSGSAGALQCPFRNAVCCGSGSGKAFVASACCPVSHSCRQVGASWKCHASGPSSAVAGATARQAAGQVGGRFAQALKNQQQVMGQISGSIQKAIQQLTSRAQTKQQGLTALQNQKNLQSELKTIQQLEKKAASQASGENKPSQNIIIVKNINVLTHVPQGSNLKLSGGKKPW